MWKSPVKAAHLFLSEEETENIKNYVPRATQETPYLIIVINEHQVPVGFMGVAERHLEMFFISDVERGKGLGRELLTFRIGRYSVNDPAVNKQNPLAGGLYEYMGFKVYGRIGCDG